MAQTPSNEEQPTTAPTPLIRTEYMRLDDLLKCRAPRNPKEHADDISVSIRRFGYVEPITIDERTGLLVAGHGRIDHLEEMRLANGNPPQRILQDTDSMWMVPVTRGVSFNSDEEAEAYLLASNRLVEAGGWDNALLAQMLTEHAADPEGLRGLGWSDEDVAALLEQALKEAEPQNVSDDAEPRFEQADELQEIWGTALGQIWLVPSKTLPGSFHRILCGDATNPVGMQRLLGQKLVHMVFTDPPYNIAYEGHVGSVRRTIQNDDMGDKYPEFLRQAFLLIKHSTLPGAAIYVSFGGEEWPVVDTQIRDAGFHWSCTIIWVKDSMVLSRRDYHPQYEPLWYGWNDAAARLHPLDDRTQTDVWQVDRPKRSEEFPIMKPIELMERALRNSTLMGEDCLDPFLGSGSTLVACERTGRRGYGCELDPTVLAIALQRFKDMGLSPVLFNDA